MAIVQRSGARHSRTTSRRRLVPTAGEVFQADEAHTGNATSADQFGLKRGREQALQHDWINSEIDEDPSIDHASYHR